MYRWELDDSAQPTLDELGTAAQALLTSFMDAVVIVDPIDYQRHPGARSDPPAPLRTLHFGRHHEGLVTFLVYLPDELVLVVRIQWLGEQTQHQTTVLALTSALGGVTTRPSAPSATRTRDLLPRRSYRASQRPAQGEVSESATPQF